MHAQGACNTVCPPDHNAHRSQLPALAQGPQHVGCPDFKSSLRRRHVHTLRRVAAGAAREVGIVALGGVSRRLQYSILIRGLLSTLPCQCKIGIRWPCWDPGFTRPTVAISHCDKSLQLFSALPLQHRASYLWLSTEGSRALEASFSSRRAFTDASACQGSKIACTLPCPTLRSRVRSLAALVPSVPCAGGIQAWPEAAKRAANSQSRSSPYHPA